MMAPACWLTHMACGRATFPDRLNNWLGQEAITAACLWTYVNLIWAVRACGH